MPGLAASLVFLRPAMPLNWMLKNWLAGYANGSGKFNPRPEKVAAFALVGLSVRLFWLAPKMNSLVSVDESADVTLSVLFQAGACLKIRLSNGIRLLPPVQPRP